MTQSKTGHKIMQQLAHSSQSTKLFLAAIVHGVIVVLVCLIIAEVVKAV